MVYTQATVIGTYVQRWLLHRLLWCCPVPISAFTNVHNSKLAHLYGNLLSVEVFVVVCNEHTSYNTVYPSKHVSIILIQLRYKIAILLHAWYFSSSIVCCVFQLLINSVRYDE